MNGLSHLTAGAFVQFAILAALFAGSGAVWYVALRRWSDGRPLIRLARRRPVPWQGLEVLLIFFVGFGAFPYFALLVAKAAAPVAVQPVAVPHAADKGHSNDHPAEQLLRLGDSRQIVLAIIIAVAVAPVYEELLFRVLLQGWLEAVWSRSRRRRRELRSAPASWLPVVLPAALFAMIHFRSAAPPQSNDFLWWVFLVQMVGEITTIGFAIVLLRSVAGAKAADFGWSPRKLGFDARLALAALVAVTPLLLVFNLALKVAFDRLGIPFAPDPIPLFFLALVFGWLYRRTHRLAPSLLMHAAFNATSIALLFLQPQG